MILSANHVGDSHVDVVDYHRKVVQRVSIGADQHKIFDIGTIAFLRTVDEVVESSTPVLGNFQPDCCGLTGCESASSFLERQIAIRIKFLDPGDLSASTIYYSFFDRLV